MKFEFTKIVLPIELGEYHESYAGQQLQVWVNPPREKRIEREMIIKEYPQALAKALPPVVDKENRKGKGTLPAKSSGVGVLEQDLSAKVQDVIQALNRKMFIWLVEIWSQHADPETRWSLDEVITVYEKDPTFYAWMTRRTIELMEEFRAGQKKA